MTKVCTFYNTGKLFLLRNINGLILFEIQTIFCNFAIQVNKTVNHMFKEKILDGLKKKFEGVDEKVIERIASKLDKTTTKEEEVQNAVDGVTFQSILTSESDRRADEAQKSAVENYEKKHKLKDGKPVEEPDQQQQQSQQSQEDVPAWAQALIEKNTALEAQLTNILTERTSKSRRQQYEDLFTKLTDDTAKERYMRDFDRLSFKDDDDFKTWLDERTPVIQKEVDAIVQTGAVNHPPRGGNQTKPGGEVSADVKNYLDSAANAASQTTFSSIAGLPGESAAQ